MIASLFDQLKHCAAVTAAKIVVDSRIIQRDSLMHVGIVRKIAEAFNVIVLREVIDEKPCGEYAMRIEFDALGSHGGGEMEASARFEKPPEVLQPLVEAVEIHRIAIAAQAEMFDGVEAG